MGELIIGLYGMNYKGDKRMNKYEELHEYIINKINKIDKEIAQLQAKKEAYHDIELELCTFVTNEIEE